MKKIIFLFIPLLVLLAPAYVLASSCEGTESLPDYYVLFTVNGEEIIFEYGLSDDEVNPFAVVFGGVETNIFATDDATASNENEPNHYILFFMLGAEVLDYTHPADPLYIEYYTASASYAITAGSLQITEFGNENGVVVGTFSITVEDMSNGAAPINLENGRFRVKRITDDSDVPWGGIE
jgi:hypothetical protein